MIAMFTQCDADYGRRVAEGIQMKAGMKETMPVGPK